MPREEFIKKYKNDCRYYFDGYYIGCIDDFLTNIYNDHEAQLKAKDERIKELEEAMKPKTCEGCKFDYDIDNYDIIDGKRLDGFRPNECYICERNMKDRYEPKDNA